MGFIVSQVGEEDQKLIRELEPKIIATLRKAASHCSRLSTECIQAKTRWFGRVSDNNIVEDQWIRTTLQMRLSRMASVLNTSDFTIRGRSIESRNRDYYGWALTPSGGWGEHTSLTDAQGQDFTIELDTGWRATIRTKFPRTIPGPSKFHAVVHELTHLILGTDDVNPPYGPTNCTTKAISSANHARNNADNWACFVDEMYHAPATIRSTQRGVLPSHTDWMRDTKLSSKLRARGPQLEAVDAALNAIQSRGERPGLRRNLKRVFDTWYTNNPNDRRRRDKKKIVDKLHKYIDEKY